LYRASVDTAPEAIIDLLDEAGIDHASLTFLVVTGGTRESVLAGLGADAPTVAEWYSLHPDSGYAVAEVDGGVVAVQHTGYADPSNDVLRELRPAQNLHTLSAHSDRPRA
jgi:hypothetical protein